MNHVFSKKTDLRQWRKNKIRAPEMKIEPPRQIKKLPLYEQLFYLYTPVPGGRTKQVLENKITSL